MYFLLTYDKLQHWLCHRERKERSEKCIHLLLHLKTIMIILIRATRKGICIILALSGSQARHGWRENMI